MNNTFPPTSQILTSPQGAQVVLGGTYDLWDDDDEFERFIMAVRESRKMVRNNGIAFGVIKGSNN